MKGGLFNKQISLPLMSIVLAMLVVLFAGWLLFTLGKREGFQKGADAPGTSKVSKPLVTNSGAVTQTVTPSSTSPSTPPSTNTQTVGASNRGAVTKSVSK